MTAEKTNREIIQEALEIMGKISGRLTLYLTGPPPENQGDASERPAQHRRPKLTFAVIA